MQLNIEQRFYIVEHFFRTSSVKQTIRNFYSTFNRKIFPKTVKQTILRLRKTGSLHNRPKLGRPTVIDDVTKTIPELKLKITESFEVVRQNTAMLRRVQGSLVRRSELVVNQQGKHFEHKNSKKTIFCS